MPARHFVELDNSLRMVPALVQFKVLPEPDIDGCSEKNAQHHKLYLTDALTVAKCASGSVHHVSEMSRLLPCTG